MLRHQIPEAEAESKELPFAIQMSSECSKYSNTYESLTTPNLEVGCATQHRRRRSEYIQASFQDPVIITKMEIAPLRGYPMELRGADVKLFDAVKQEWITIKSSLEPKESEILKLSWKSLHATRRIRIQTNVGHKYLSLGLWRLYGFQKNVKNECLCKRCMKNAALC